MIGPGGSGSPRNAVDAGEEDPEMPVRRRSRQLSFPIEAPPHGGRLVPGLETEFSFKIGGPPVDIFRTGLGKRAPVAFELHAFQADRVGDAPVRITVVVQGAAGTAVMGELVAKVLVQVFDPFAITFDIATITFFQLSRKTAPADEVGFVTGRLQGEAVSASPQSMHFSSKQAAQRKNRLSSVFAAGNAFPVSVRAPQSRHFEIAWYFFGYVGIFSSGRVRGFADSNGSWSQRTNAEY
jgi:hypothetical protein